MKAISVDPLAAFLDEDLIAITEMPQAAVIDQIKDIGIDRRAVTRPVLPVLTSGHRLRPAPEGFVALARSFGVEPTRDLGGADLSRLNLRAQPLEGANLRASDLTEADLSEARLAGSDLSNARCVGANFTYADLTGADLTGSDLVGADFTGVTMEGAKLAGTILDARTSPSITFTGEEVRTLLDKMLEFWWQSRTDSVTLAAYQAFKAGDHAATKKLLARVPVGARPAAALLTAAMTAVAGDPRAGAALLNAFSIASTAAPTLASLIYALADDEERARSLLVRGE
ncbi:MAG: pentapeptide repeat-containing protein [Elsteraceae bacterium]